MYCRVLSCILSLQALREEIKQQGSNGSKTPGTSVKKLISSTSVPPKSHVTTSSPVTTLSPQTFQSPKKPVSPWIQQKTAGSQGQSFETSLHSDSASMLAQGQNVSQSAKSPGSVSPETEKENISCVSKEEETLTKLQQSKTVVCESKLSTQKKDDCEELHGYKLMDTDYEDISYKQSENSANICEAKTPETCMETDQSELSHVRKIVFDDIVVQHHAKTGSNSKAKVISEARESVGPVDTGELAADKLSKSTGYLSLKKMLEKKSEDQISLNKSMGYLGKTKNALFMNQSTVPGRSAFVPFSQVQSLCKKEGSSVNQSVAMAIPVIIPSVSQTKSSQTASQSANITMIALPTDLQTSPMKNTSEIMQNESLFNIVPASSVFHQSGGAEVKLQSSNMETSVPTVNILTQTKESTSVVTVSSVVSKMEGSECVVSSAQSMQNLPKQLRTKFTPIRPKASPNKIQPQKEAKVDVPAYGKDNRRVSAILKEKRAKEQAEAIAKFQSSIRLPSIPFQQNISFTGNQLSALQGVQAASSNVPASEVVIIVNNQQVKLQQVIGQSPIVSNRSISNNKDSSGEDHAASVGNNENHMNEKEKDSAIDNVKSAENLTQCQVMSAESDTDTSHGTESKDKTRSMFDMKELSPVSRGSDITPTLCEGEETNEQGNSESIINIESKQMQSQERDRSENMSKNLSSDVVDQMWIETPRKIQKLNITSPFQEDSTMSLGRETPIRISKPSDLSRPESACSYGRETPSGTRKRKSSDLHARRNFKRLNSTGEENEETQNLSFILSPDSELTAGLIPRRTHSCTYELERESKVMAHNQQQPPLYQQKGNAIGGSLLPGLQSPDIHSLEQEALIESFPNSLYAMKPQHKSNRNQSSSVGVSAKSMRQSQQKLLKQQQYLDERVKNFLLTQSDSSQNAEKESNEPMTVTPDQMKTSQISPGGRSGLKIDTLIVTDRGKPYQRPSSVATVSSRGSSGVDNEPSGLPSEVADWINETIEKRQKENQSVMSEPEFRDYQMLKADRNPKLQNFRFEVNHPLQSRDKNRYTNDGQSKNLKEKFESKICQQLSNDDSNFTVPKAPPVSNPRTKDTLRLNTDISSVSQRCQSLPIFASPVQSPVSPMAPPTCRIHINQRASSMSPRAQIPEHSTEVFSPATVGMLSPVKRKEVRDGLAVQLSSLGHRDSKQGTYLASIQHSLQKPVDALQEVVSPQDSTYGKNALAGLISGEKAQTAYKNRSRESSLDTDDRFVSKTPFSDSGYHSSGPSPILNSTPVSAAESSEILLSHGKNMRHKQCIMESPINMVTDYTGPLQQLSPQKSPNRPQLNVLQENVTIATNQLNNSGINPNQLRSSIHSAFIPIQGSHHDVRYVTPIKPMVTLPDTGVGQSSVSASSEGSGSLFIDASQTVLSSDVTMVSPRSADPPSYEVAIKQLKKSTPAKTGTVNQSQASEIVDLDLCKEQIPLYDLQSHSSENLGPFAQKLIKLSQQTQNVGKDIQTLLRNEIKSDSDLVSMGTISTQTQFIPSGSDLSNVSHASGNSQPDVSSADIDHSGANFDFDITGDVNIYTSTLLHSEQKQTILKPNSAIKGVISENFPEHSMLVSSSISDSVLNIAPSFHPASHFGSASQTAETDMLPSFHHNESASLNITEDGQQLRNQPNFSLQRDLNETQRLQITNVLFGSDGAFNRNDNTSAIRNLLIGGKAVNHDVDMVVDGGQNKQEEITQQELMDDIGLPWDSLREIEGDLEDFNMFN